MPTGVLGQMAGTAGPLHLGGGGVGDGSQRYKSKVVAPRNPRLVREEPSSSKVE